MILRKVDKALKAQKVENHGLKPSVDKLGYTSFTKEKGRDFRILQLTDVHIGNGILSIKEDRLAKNAVIKLVEYTKPDLIILTGDNTYPIPIFSGAYDNLKEAKVFAKVMETFEIPWTFVYGNHDVESYARYDKTKISSFYSSLKHCLFQRGDESLSGQGNYIINIRNDDGSINNSLVMLDSNMYAGKTFFAGFDIVHDDQVAWYENEINKLKTSNGGSLNSLMFLHIPFVEYKEAWADYRLNGDKNVTIHCGFVGEKDEYFGVPKQKGKLFDTILKVGSTKGVFAGHDHLNTISMTYKGIRLTYGMSIDYLAYKKIDKKINQRGGTVITLHDDNSFDVDHIALKNIK